MSIALTGARILIVGGSSGIGFAVAQSAIDEGAEITIASANAERLNAAAGRLGQVETIQMDVTNEGEVAQAFQRAGTFDHIIFTAGDWGGNRRGPIAELDRAVVEKIYNVRFWGALNVVKYGAKALSELGSFTLTGGMTAHQPQHGTVIATALSGSLEFTTRALAVELAPKRVNAVCPGPTLTEAWEVFPAALRRQADKHLEGQLIKRLAKPEEVAAAYIYLLKGSYTTGQVLYVEGGSMLGG